MVSTTESSSSPPPPTDPVTGESRRPRRLAVSPLMIGAVAAAVVAGILVARLLVTAFTPHLYVGTVLQGDTPAPDMGGLTFTRTGRPVDPAAFDDDVVLVFFGYTNCPDVCPATMALAAQAVGGLDGDDRARTEVWMVSVDPERDDAASLQTYVEFFDPAFEGVTGPTESIGRVTTNYGVYYQVDPTAAEGADDYLVDHTASLFGIGPDGGLRIVWPPTVTADQLRTDIEELLG